MSLRLGRVVEVHPEDHSVDLVMVDDYSRLTGVQVISSNASTNSGTTDMPTPTPAPGSDKWSLAARTDRDMIAVVGSIGRTPVVVGFLFPQVNQVLFKDKDRKMSRHSSDVYTTIDSAGNTEFFHPSGTYVRIGSSPAHEDLSNGGADSKFAPSKNTSSAPYLRVRVANGGAAKATIDIDPSGNVSITNAGTLQVNSAGVATVTAPTINLVGNVNITGNLATSGGSVSSNGNVTITGNVATTGTLQNNGKNVGSTHTHGGVVAGGANTAVPN